jgi:hypothetical protein
MRYGFSRIQYKIQSDLKNSNWKSMQFLLRSIDLGIIKTKLQCVCIINKKYHENFNIFWFKKSDIESQNDRPLVLNSHISKVEKYQKCLKSKISSNLMESLVV